jgi:hypothetical protein
MDRDCCPSISVAIMIGSLLLYFPLAHLLPESAHRFTGFVLACSAATFLGWCAVCYVTGHRRQP